VIGKCVAALLIIGLIIALPVILPFVFIQMAIDRRRMVKAAEGFHCTSCGAVLGKMSLKLADEEWAKHMQQLHQDHPGVKFRVIRMFHAICASCGRRFRYDASGFSAMVEPEPQVEKDGRRYTRSGVKEN
jgi:hypothetical protein